METLKCLLAILCCVPFMMPLLWLCGTAMDYLCGIVDDASDSALYQFLVKPIAGFFIAFVVPLLFIGMAVGIWILSAMLWGIY